jgi:hypothetical protein
MRNAGLRKCYIERIWIEVRNTCIVFEVLTAVAMKRSFLLALLADCFKPISCFSPENGGDVSPKRRFIFIGLYGVIFQKVELVRKI